MKAVDAVPALLPTTVIGSYSLPRWLEVARESHKESLNPDCGLKFTRRAVAFAKPSAMTEGAALVRRELGEEGRR